MRQVKSRTPASAAHTPTKSVCTRLKAVPACLRHCQDMMRQSILLVLQCSLILTFVSLKDAILLQGIVAMPQVH